MVLTDYLQEGFTIKQQVNRTISKPLSNQVYSILVSRIQNNEYPKDSRLPNEMDFCEEFHVSRPTIRKALDMLEKDGAIIRMRPKGTYVVHDYQMPQTVSCQPSIALQNSKLQIAMEEFLIDQHMRFCLDGFTAESNHEVEIIHWSSWNDAMENIITSYVNNRVPDVFSISNDAVGLFARMGVIRALDDFIEEEKLKLIKKRCQHYGLGAYLFDGKLYGFPLFSESRLLIYRKDRFQNAGIEDPLEHPFTHETFLEAAKELSNPERGLYAYAFPYANDPFALQSLAPWIIQRGGRFWRVENGRVVAATDEKAFIDAFQWYLDLTLKHHICPDSKEPLNIRDITNRLMNGSISMMIAPPSYYKFCVDSSPTGSAKYGIAPIPAGPANSFSFMGGMPLCISSKCKNPELAWNLISHMTRSENLFTYLNRTGSLLPIELYSIEEIKSNSPYTFHVIADALETAVPHTYPLGYNQCMECMPNGYGQIPISRLLHLSLTGQMSTEDAIKFLTVTLQSLSNQRID